MDFFEERRHKWEEEKEQFGARLFFVNDGHTQRFLQALRDSGKIDPDGSIDRQYGAVFYIFTAHEDIWESVKSHVPPYGPYGWIDFSSIYKIPFGGGATRMIKLANSLYNGNPKIDVFDTISNLETRKPRRKEKVDMLDTISNLDSTNFKVVIDAIALCYYGLVLPK